MLADDVDIDEESDDDMHEFGNEDDGFNDENKQSLACSLRAPGITLFFLYHCSFGICEGLQVRLVSVMLRPCLTS